MKVLRGLTKLFGLGFLYFGSCLNSDEHFGFILIAFILCGLLCFGCLYIRSEIDDEI